MLKIYKKIIFDVFLNICATALPLVTLQIIILPLVARYMENELYGKMLTVVSLLTVICGSLGNSLNNIRLIKAVDYEINNVAGDFNVLVIAGMILACISVCIISLQYHITLTDIILLALLALLWTYREYAVVVFRIKLNFKGVVVNNVIMVFGYLVGFILFLLTSYWQCIYITGIACSVIYVIKVSDILKEKLAITMIFKSTFTDLVMLVTASLMLNLFNYADRMLIYPMIGGRAVSIYYASTIFGKVVSSAVSPINAVVLSYLSKKNYVKRKNMIIVIIISLVVACIGYVLCIAIAKPALSILYPGFVKESLNYVPIMTVVAMIMMMSGVLSPFVLKFCKMQWQIVINGIVLFLYVFVSVYLFERYNLMGFCIGVLVSNIVKLIIMILLGICASGKEGI